MNIKKLGAIDIGSNGVRLLISNVLEEPNEAPKFTKASLVREHGRGQRPLHRPLTCFSGPGDLEAYFHWHSDSVTGGRVKEEF